MLHQLKTDVTGNTHYDKILSSLLFIYCLALPFEEALASSLGSILRILGILIIGYCFIVYTRHVYKMIDLRLFSPFLFWILFSFISVMWSKDFAWWLYFFKIYIVQIIFVVVILIYNKFINIDYIANGLISGALVASSLLVFMPSASVLSDDGRRSIILFGKAFDPNIVASIIILGMFFAIGKIFNNRKNIKVLLLIVAFLAIGMLFTGSRGALISFVISFGLLLLRQVKDRKAIKRTRIIIALCVGIVIIALIVLPPELLLSRFSKETLFGINEYQNGVHNRYTIWQRAATLIKDAPIIGYGCGNFFSAIATVYKQSASHNLYILLIIENGIIGLAIFSFGLIRILKVLYHKHLYFIFAMLLSVCIMALTLDTITYKYFWVCIMTSIMYILKTNEKEKIDE